jgi:LEA14-like dessication related protein
MNHSATRTVLCGGLLLGLLLCCKTVEPSPLPVEPPPELPPPKAPVSSLSFEKIEARNVNAIDLHFVLSLENPRDEGATASVGDWGLTINGSSLDNAALALGAKVLTENLAVDPGETAGYSLVLELDLEKLALAGLPQADDYEIDLAADVDFIFEKGPAACATALGRAEFPRIREPVFKITAIAVLKAELINTRFRVSVRIENPNPFPVDLSAFIYELYGGGRFWADGKEKDVFHIPARSSADARLFLVMNFIDMKRDLLDQVIALRQVRYRFAGEAEVSTGVAYLPQFRTGFDLSGLSEVYN